MNMDKRIYKILIVDDEKDFRDTLKMLFDYEGYETKCVSSGREALDTLKNEQFSIVVTDMMMDGMDGLELLSQIKAQGHDELEVILATGYGSIETAVEAMKKGAFGYFIKGHDPDELLHELEKAISVIESRNRKYDYESDAEALVTSDNPAMKKVWDMIRSVAGSSASVLITGESGTGKEIAAGEIHRLSTRRDMPFVAVNCQQFPQNLIEAELFGYEKGAFTGAAERRIGRLEQANGGSLFLDEIGDMNLEVQVKLLRVLETKKFERLGSVKTISTNVRIISATNQNLEKLIAQKAFREDLLYRINTIEIKIPPLRDRREDIKPLIDLFVRKFSRETGKKNLTIESDTMRYLLHYDYPGNIRELKNIIERMTILSGDDGTLKLSSDMGKAEPAVRSVDGGITRAAEDVPSYKDAKREFETAYIESVMTKCEGNITKAAGMMNISRRQLYNKIHELGLEPDLK